VVGGKRLSKREREGKKAAMTLKRKGIWKWEIVHKVGMAWGEVGVRKQGETKKSIRKGVGRVQNLILRPSPEGF